MIRADVFLWILVFIFGWIGASRGWVREEVRPPSPPAQHDPLDAGIYAGFEERFRGREDVIRQCQMTDAQRFVGSPGLVVDLGCGRGEFLEALRELGVAAEGCDTNAVAVARDPAVNSVFVTLPRSVRVPLAEWSFFWVWDDAADLVRWMCSFDTTEADVDDFLAGVSAIAAEHG